MSDVVPASRLRRPPPAARAKQSPVHTRVEHIRVVVADGERHACRVCGERPRRGQMLPVLSPVVDRSNGQRITIAVCRACIHFACRDLSVKGDRR